MGLVLPFFLAGLALLVLPYLFHRIRRPDKKIVRFSSLMFVPQIKKEVVEKRRIQHILLMLLRMLMLALLVLAFSRPYRTVREILASPSAAPEYHLIMVDTSLSMSTGDTMEQARAAARKILDHIPAVARVGLLSFDSTPRMRTPFEQGDAASSHALTRTAIDELVSGAADTNYLSALQASESLLLSMPTSNETLETCVLHMVSDFRRSGLPRVIPAWRLSGRIRFEPYVVGAERFDNVAITDVTVRLEEDGKARVLARLKNYSNQSVTLNASLELAQGPQTRTITIGPGNASNVSFEPIAAGERLQGQVRIPEDGFVGDNQRNLLWLPSVGRRVWLLGDASSRDTYGDLFFLEKGLAAAGPRTWLTSSMKVEDLPGRLAAEPTPVAILLGESDGLAPAVSQALVSYVKDGGSLLLCLGERMPLTRLNSDLLAHFGIKSKGPNTAKPDPGQFASLGWIDFDQPAFSAFKAARFNDFSTLRFNNFHKLELESKVIVQARVGMDDGSLVPVMVETQAQKGKVFVWAFSPRLTWTNLPKHAKWVPLLQEQLQALVGLEQDKLEFSVGQNYPLDRLESSRGSFYVRGPDQQEHVYKSRAELTALPLNQAGFLEFREATDAPWRAQAAVNARSGEGDPDRIPAQEFALKLTTSKREASVPGQSVRTYGQERQRRGEWGYWLAALALAFLLVETVYALKLGKRRPAVAT